MRKTKKTASKNAGIKTKKNPATKKQLKAAASSQSAFPSTQLPLLNDYCILEIFSKLKMKELCSVKSCSRKFSSLADDTVQRRFRGEYVCLPGNETSAADAASFLSNFGMDITHLQIDDDNQFIRFCNNNTRKGQKFHLLLKKCQKLKFLRLKNVDFANAGFNKLKPILQNIDTLELINCNLSPDQVKVFLKSCKKMSKLSIDGNLSAEICESIHTNVRSMHKFDLKECDLTTKDDANLFKSIDIFFRKEIEIEKMAGYEYYAQIKKQFNLK